jgi:hypothetical protein
MCVSFIRVYLVGVSLIGVYLIGLHLIGMYLIGVSLICLHLITSLPCAQDTGGENPRISTKDVLRLLIVACFPQRRAA